MIAVSIGAITTMFKHFTDTRGVDRITLLFIMDANAFDVFW